jgi:gamma-glutamyltranspeptidase/glutathione hydrolase
VTPAAADGWLTALKLYGTMSFEQVVTPALELAERGFPIPDTLHRALTQEADKFVHDDGNTQRWSSTSEIFYPQGKALETGDVLVQRDLARTFHRLIEVEKTNQALGREGAIQAARDFFYRGEIAEEMARFSQEQGGLLTLEDLADFQVGVELPPSIDYKGIDVYACGPWCQGPVTLQTLRIVEDIDLAGMGHNTPEYLHTVIEALKLAYADRHAYYGDPDFVDVPMQGLLDRSYAKGRANNIDSAHASPGMPLAGDPWPYQGGVSPRERMAEPEPVAGRLQADTSYICVLDRWGNAFSATPSDGIAGAPVVSGLGFMMSARGSQTWLDPEHPCALAPGKRPRLTPNPAMALRDGKVWMPFGTPAGDVQCQSMTQLFLNVVEFGMNVQEAIEAPRVSTWSFPNSFYPHAYHPGLVGVEGRFDQETVAELERRGHQIEVWNDWTPRMGSMSAIEIDRERGALFAGADLRRDSYAMGR